MKFLQPLVRARLVARYKRFFADVELAGGQIVTAHCPNPGAMLGLNAPGMTVFVSPAPGAKRRLAWTLELVQTAGGLVGVNTLAPNRLVEEALAEGLIAELAGYDRRRREVRMGEASRVDFLLQSDGRPACWLEVKNCHLSRRDGLAEFPDCVAARSLKHLRELEAMARCGSRAVALFVIQRTDCEAFAACRDLDPAFAAGLDHAAANGVEVFAYACEMSLTGVRIHRRLPWLRAATPALNSSFRLAT